MKYDIKKHDKTLEVKVKLTKDDISKDVTKIKDYFAKSVKVPGFRNGKIPEHILSKHVTDGMIKEELVRVLTNRVLQDLDTNKEMDEYDVIETPTLKEFDCDLKTLDAKLVVEFDLLPKVEVKSYKGLCTEVEKPVEISDERLMDQISYYFSHKRKLIPAKDGVIKRGHSVTFDFVGRNEAGEAFPGGTSKDYELVVGSGGFIPGFEEQMIGLNVGQTKIIKVDFPADYPQSDLAGRPAHFELTIKKVNEVEKPEINDQSVAELGLNDIKTLDKFKEVIKTNMGSQAAKEYERNTNKLILDKLAKAVEVEIPESLIKIEKEKLTETLHKELKDGKISYKDYLKNNGLTEALLQNNLRGLAINNIKSSLALQYVIEKEDLKVSDKEIEKYIEDLAVAYKMKAEDLKKSIRDMDIIEVQLLNEKAMNFLREN